jgi:hypothetical protein
MPALSRTFSFLLASGFALLALASCGPGLVFTGAASSSSFGDLMASQMHRDRSAAQKTLEQEVSLGTEPLFTGYRNIPSITNDDEGYTGTSVVKATRPSQVCGTSQNTVQGRIADCIVQNPNTAAWDGSTNGNSGQGTWRLVTYDGSYEVWRDERTQLLWSDRLGTENWCRASGNSGGGPAGEVDTFNYCDNAANQDQTTPDSLCAEASGYNTSAAYDAMKGQMRLAPTASSPAVVWRLPTVYDFKLAEVNGLRFVVPNIVDSFWSATVNSGYRQGAWFFYGMNGYYDGGALRNNGALAVRCVGR